MTTFIPYARPYGVSRAASEISNVLDSGMLTGGTRVAEFESQLSQLFGGSHVVSTASGTMALYLLAKALRIDENSAIVTPSVTFLASANGFSACGAEVILADVDPESGLMTVDHAREACERASKPVAAIIVVHLGGRIADLPGLRALADELGAQLIDDACHAIGSVELFGEQKHTIGCGRLAHASTFSFHPTKTISCSEGGAVTTADARMAERMAVLRNHGMVRQGPFQAPEVAIDAKSGAQNPWYYESQEPSLNTRLSEVHAAIGLSQLEIFDEIATRRHAVRAVYEARLPQVSDFLVAQPERPSRLVDHLYQVAIDFDAMGRTRIEFMEALRMRGVGSQVHYTPLHLQPSYRRADVRLAGAERFYEQTLTLPLHAGMTEADALRVCDAVADVVLLNA